MIPTLNKRYLVDVIRIFKGKTRYCRKKTNIKDLRSQINILQSIQKELEFQLSKNNNKNNKNNKNKDNNKLLKDLNALKLEKQELQNQLNEERNVINKAIIIDLNNIKTELKTCNNDKTNIDKLLQQSLKEQKQLVQIRDALRQEVIKLENKIKIDEDKLKNEQKTCSYEKNVLLQKLNIIQSSRDKLAQDNKNDGQLQVELNKQIAIEDSLREQLRNFTDNCNTRITDLTKKLEKSNNSLTESRNKFTELANRLLEVRKNQLQLQKDLNDCNQKNKILTEELKKSELQHYRFKKSN